ncbi:hypothetical protein HAX54_032432 [Datura stramonium]|uniref:Uncharacterized protein n=1 Tax=Datura stramonium TaxID=4076 RepID=A0ABS8VB36_DATST|nr:hypothetical protein [Datura stramonium]
MRVYDTVWRRYGVIVGMAWWQALRILGVRSLPAIGSTPSSLVSQPGGPIICTPAIRGTRAAQDSNACSRSFRGKRILYDEKDELQETDSWFLQSGTMQYQTRDRSSKEQGRF